MFPKALILYLGTSGAKPRDYPCSYSFLLIHLCRNVTVRFYLCFTRQLRWFCEEKLTKKIIFYCDYEALKVFRKYRCHPVVGSSGRLRVLIYHSVRTPRTFPIVVVKRKFPRLCSFKQHNKDQSLF
jgi:hypothetical protein